MSNTPNSSSDIDDDFEHVPGKNSAPDTPSKSVNTDSKPTEPTKAETEIVDPPNESKSYALYESVDNGNFDSFKKEFMSVASVNGCVSALRECIKQIEEKTPLPFDKVRDKLQEIKSETKVVDPIINNLSTERESSPVCKWRRLKVIPFESKFTDEKDSKTTTPPTDPETKSSANPPPTDNLLHPFLTMLKAKRQSRMMPVKLYEMYKQWIDSKPSYSLQRQTGLTVLEMYGTFDKLNSDRKTLLDMYFFDKVQVDAMAKCIELATICCETKDPIFWNKLYMIILFKMKLVSRCKYFKNKDVLLSMLVYVDRVNIPQNNYKLSNSIDDVRREIRRQIKKIIDNTKQIDDNAIINYMILGIESVPKNYPTMMAIDKSIANILKRTTKPVVKQDNNLNFLDYSLIFSFILFIFMLVCKFEVLAQYKPLLVCLSGLVFTVLILFTAK